MRRFSCSRSRSPVMRKPEITKKTSTPTKPPEKRRRRVVEHHEHDGDRAQPLDVGTERQGRSRQGSPTAGRRPRAGRPLRWSPARRALPSRQTAQGPRRRHGGASYCLAPRAQAGTAPRVDAARPALGAPARRGVDPPMPPRLVAARCRRRCHPAQRRVRRARAAAGRSAAAQRIEGLSARRSTSVR